MAPRRVSTNPHSREPEAAEPTSEGPGKELTSEIGTAIFFSSLVSSFFFFSSFLPAGAGSFSPLSAAGPAIAGSWFWWPAPQTRSAHRRAPHPASQRFLLRDQLPDRPHSLWHRRRDGRAGSARLRA